MEDARDRLIGHQRPIVRAFHQAIRSVTHSINFLPTGTALLFQFLLPIVSQEGKCSSSPTHKIMTEGLIAACALVSLLRPFTDVYTASDGAVYYGIATARGLWVPLLPNRPARIAARYKLELRDFVHAILSLLVFAASSVFAPNVKTCFGYTHGLPALLQELLPVGIAIVASFIFMLFPSKRTGCEEPID